MGLRAVVHQQDDGVLPGQLEQRGLQRRTTVSNVGDYEGCGPHPCGVHTKGRDICDHVHGRAGGSQDLSCSAAVHGGNRQQHDALCQWQRSWTGPAVQQLASH